MYKDVTSIVVVLGGTPTGKVPYEGGDYAIPQTRLDTFVALYLKLLNEGGRPLGVLTDYRQTGAMEHYIKSELKRCGVPEEKINLYREPKARFTIENALNVKNFLLKEDLEGLPCYVVTSEEHMRTVAEKDFDVCFGDDIKLLYQLAPWGFPGVRRFKAEVHGVLGKLLDLPVTICVSRGDHKKLAWKNEMFYSLREAMRRVSPV